VTAGNLLVGFVTMTSGESRTFTWSDDKSNSWVEDVQREGSAPTQVIASADNVASGATQVTVTLSSSGNFFVAVVEVSGADTTDAYDTGTQNSDATSDNNDDCSTGFTTAADVFVIAGGVSNSSHSGFTQPTSWTMITSSTSTRPRAAAYIESAGGLSSDLVRFTHSGTARTWVGMAAAYKAAAGGADPEGSLIHGKLLNGLLTKGVLVG
jgi:hypothetical protein